MFIVDLTPYPFVLQRHDQVHVRNGKQSCKGNRHTPFYKEKNSPTSNHILMPKPKILLDVYSRGLQKGNHF